MTLPTPTLTTRSAAAETTTNEETAVRLDTVQDLLTAIDTLEQTDREVARRRVAEAIEEPAAAARAALGLLALDVAGWIADQPSAQIIVLPDTVETTAVSA